MTMKITVKGQELNLLDNNQLSIVQNKTKPLDSWILDTFFPNKVGFDNQKAVPIDELETSQPLAPFVSPVVQGKPIREQGNFERKYIQAPYVKPAKMITPANTYDLALFTRLKDATIIKGDMSMSDKWRLAQIGAFNELRQSIVNRKVLMACDILTKGKTIAVGDDHAAMEIDFGRHSNLSFTPVAKWHEPDADVVGDIETMNARLIEHGGTGASVILTSSKLYMHMVRNKGFTERFIDPKGSTAPNPFNLGLAVPNAKYRGEIDGIAVYTYDEKHKLDGKAERFISEKGFYMIADTTGYQAQCEIQHLSANGRAVEFFDYSVVQEDPSGIKMICESSPLIVPSNVNGVCGGDEFID
ncbi:major capsid protein [Moraxella bovis]|uniref:Phage major capsid protein E n=1 Tax=Moraxella bovis TaxID=476 RepID=A0A378PY20_MORBO|nr:major capsid protein [Moraxella bovis]STY93430.1 Phage major capsid protein E [Moraxella bovis]